MQRQLTVSKISSGVLEIAGHNIPAYPAISQMVERREFAREGKWMLLDDRACNDKTQMFGHIAKRGNQTGRVIRRQLHAFAHGSVAAALICIIDADCIGKEDRIELTPLSCLRQFDPGFQFGKIALLAGVRPSPLTV